MTFSLTCPETLFRRKTRDLLLPDFCLRKSWTLRTVLVEYRRLLPIMCRNLHRLYTQQRHSIWLTPPLLSQILICLQIWTFIWRKKLSRKPMKIAKSTKRVTPTAVRGEWSKPRFLQRSNYNRNWIQTENNAISFNVTNPKFPLARASSRSKKLRENKK